MPSIPPYPEEFRRDAVALVRSSEKSIPQLAKELGVSRGFHAWEKRPPSARAVQDAALSAPIATVKSCVVV
jgi:hypothetical protein